jgi:hypothetical protein
MKNSQKFWRALLFVLLIAAMGGSFVLPEVNRSVKAAPQLQTTTSCSTRTPIAKWTFDSTDPSVMLQPTTGTGTFTFGSDLSGPSAIPGQAGNSSDFAANFGEWPNAHSDNAYLQIDVSTEGKTFLGLSFDYLATTEGPGTLQLYYSTNGTDFIQSDQIISIQKDTKWHSDEVDLSGIPSLENNPNAKFRLYGVGSTNPTETLAVDNLVLCFQSVVTIDSISPNPTSNVAKLTWHSIVNGQYEVRIGGTSCNNGKRIDNGTYGASPDTATVDLNGNNLVEGTNTIRVCLVDQSNITSFAVNTITKDSRRPSVTIALATGQSGSTLTLPINFTAVFSEPINVNSFVPTDITQNGNAKGITWKITTTNNTSFILQAVTVSGAGSVTPFIAAGAVDDLAGNKNTDSNQVTVNYGSSSALVLINEVAWSGTAANPTNNEDEWIELHNPSSDTPVDLTNWVLKSSDNTPNIKLSGTIKPGEFLVFARNVNTFQSQPIVAYSVDSTINLSNSGETLSLIDSNNKTIDSVSSTGGAWPAGTGSSAFASMERVEGTNQWVTYGGTVPVAYDRNGNPIKGTPGKENWITTTTITTITSDSPDPSLVNGFVTVYVSVVGGTTIPTGTVAITGTDANCAFTLTSNGTGNCAVKFTSVGNKTITANYGGDATHPASSDTESHTVARSTVIVPTTVPTAAPPPPLVAINEFVPRPGHDWNSDGVVNVGDEYIEVLNHGTINVDLSGYSLDDEVNVGSEPYRLPAVTLRPGERYVFYGSETGLLLGDGGDGVRLLKPNGQLADAYNYTVVERPDQSYCRLPDNGGADDWNQNCYPTPGLQNSLNEGSTTTSSNTSKELYCPISDTLPEDFAQAECEPFGNNIWNPDYWNQTGWYGDQILPDIQSKWPVFAN